MARARNIKPSLFKNELLGTANPLLTLLFEGLWCLADRRGRLEDRPMRINVEIFPYRGLSGEEVDGYLNLLAAWNFIRRYEVDGERIIQVVKFEKHQSPHNTEKESELPPQPPNYKALTEITVDSPLNNESLTVDSRTHNALIPDSLIADSPILIEAGGGSKTEDSEVAALSTFPVFSKNGRPNRSLTAVNSSAHTELLRWLDAVARSVGAGSRDTLADLQGWETTCIKAISEKRSLDDLIHVIDAEMDRTTDCPQFFSCTTVLKKLQAQSAKRTIRKFAH